jgi:transposase
MGQKFRSGRGPDEVMLMPADPREWLPPGHLAWKVISLAGEMDLSRFGAGYRADGQGGRPYHPRMMATLLLYGYCRGRRSSREVEMATFDDVGARIICGGLHPDHSTVAEFVRRNAGAVLALLPESVRACAAEGLVDLALVAGDGTKLKASASMAGNLTREQLDAQVAELQALIDGELRAWVQDLLDAGGITPPAGDDRGDGGPGDGGGPGGKRKWKKKPARAGQVLERRLAARARLDALQGKDQGRHDARIAELAARVQRKEAALARWEARARARAGARAATIAAGLPARGRAPLPASADRDVTRARQALADARADHAAALAGTASAGPRPDGRRRPGRPAGDKPAGARQASEAGQEAKASPADPSSRVMPLKKGGYDQLFNVQALATARAQVILAIMRHDSPADAQALLPLLAEARRVLAAAGVPGQIGKALFDTGYASDANFTAAIPETLARRPRPRSHAPQLAGHDRPPGHPRRQAALPAALGHHRARLRPAHRPSRPRPALPRRPRRRRARPLGRQPQHPQGHHRPRQAPRPPGPHRRHGNAGPRRCLTRPENSRQNRPQPGPG